MDLSKERFDPNDPSNVKVSVNEAVKKMIMVENRNDGPLTKSIVAYNNKFFSKWGDAMKKNGNMISSKELDRNLMIFTHHYYADKRNELEKFLPNVDHDIFLFWVNFLSETDPSVLVTYGLEILWEGYDIVMKYVKKYVRNEMHKRVYSNAKTHQEALELFGKEFKLNQGEELPSGLTLSKLTTINENMMIITKSSPNFQN